MLVTAVLAFLPIIAGLPSIQPEGIVIADQALFRNHGLQSQRRSEPEVLQAWAQRQSRNLLKRYRPSVALDDLSPHRVGKRQELGYEELFNMFSDTEVSSKNLLSNFSLVSLTKILIFISIMVQLSWERHPKPSMSFLILAPPTSGLPTQHVHLQMDVQTQRLATDHFLRIPSRMSTQQGTTQVRMQFSRYPMVPARPLATWSATLCLWLAIPYRTRHLPAVKPSLPVY